MKSRILKKNDKCYLELPEEFTEIEELELTPAKDGIYLLTFEKPVTSKKPELPPQKKELTIEGPECAVLQKLISIKFEKRTPAFVSSTFSEAEKKLLNDLEKKKYINVFYGGKYKQTGVYNINDKIYLLIIEKKPAVVQTVQKNMVKSPVQNSTPPKPVPSDLLAAQGFVVIPDSNQAFGFSEFIKKQGKQNSIYGIKGFDGRFYVASKRYFDKYSELIKNSLNEDLTTAQLAEKCKMHSEGCAVILHLLSERGEVIEKRKGIFSLA